MFDSHKIRKAHNAENTRRYLKAKAGSHKRKSLKLLWDSSIQGTYNKKKHGELTHG